MGDLIQMFSLVVITVGKGIRALGIVAVEIVAADDPGAIGHHSDMSSVLQHIALCDAEGVAASGENTDPVDTPLRTVDLKDIAGFDSADIGETRPGTGIVIVVDIADKVGCISTAPLAAVGGELRSLGIAPGDAVLPASVVDEVVHLLGGCGSGSGNRIGLESDNAGVIGLASVLAETAHFIGFACGKSVVELFAFADLVPDWAGSEGAVLGDNAFRMGGPVAALGSNLSTALRDRQLRRVFDRKVKPGCGRSDIRHFRTRDGRHGCRQRGGRQTEDRSDDHSQGQHKFGEFLHSAHPFDMKLV